MIDWKNFFDQPVKNNKITDENTRKIAAGKRRLHNWFYVRLYFIDYFKMIAIDLESDSQV